MSGGIEMNVLVDEPESLFNTAPESTDAILSPRTVNGHSRQLSTATSTGYRPSLFDMAHSRHANRKVTPQKMHFHAHEAPTSWRHLFKPPVVRQFLAGKILCREVAEREAARFELFFDLVFVGIIHQLAEQATDIASATSWGVYLFIVFFWMSWSVWQDARSFINTSGTDDIPQRVFILAVMCLLLGFSSNAAAVIIECPSAAEVTAPSEAIAGRLSRLRADDLGLNTLLPGGCELVQGWEKNVRGALAFYLIAKLLRVVSCVFYGWFIPRFREAHFSRAAAITVSSVIYLPLAFVHHTLLFLVLPVVAISLELTSSYTLAIGLWLVDFLRKSKPNKIKKSKNKPNGALPPQAQHRLQDSQNTFVPTLPDQASVMTAKVRHFSNSFVPALNIEHVIERTSLFIVLVLGEMIINVTFRALGTQAGIHSEYLRCCLGLLVAYFYNWIYADSDGARCYFHALRRHWFTSITWTHLHFPLAASLIFSSAALPTLVATDSPAQEFRWFFGIGSSITMLSIAGIGLMHRSLDEPHASLLHRYWRLFGRVVLAVVYACLPLAKLTSTKTLAIHACLLFCLTAFETISKFGSLPSPEKIDIALGKTIAEDETDYDLTEELEEMGVNQIDVSEHELLDHERGEDDVGVEADLGQLRALKVGPQQRLAYAF